MYKTSLGRLHFIVVKTIIILSHALFFHTTIFSIFQLLRLSFLVFIQSEALSFVEQPPRGPRKSHGS